MPQSGVKEKQGHQGPIPSRTTNRLQENCLPCPRPSQNREAWREKEKGFCGLLLGVLSLEKMYLKPSKALKIFHYLKKEKKNQKLLDLILNSSKNVWDNPDKSLFLQGSLVSPLAVKLGLGRGSVRHVWGAPACVQQ